MVSAGVMGIVEARCLTHPLMGLSDGGSDGNSEQVSVVVYSTGLLSQHVMRCIIHQASRP